MLRTLILISFLSITFGAKVQSQTPENLSVGLYGRTEQNVFRYYNGLSRGNFSTQRVSNGYSAGVMVHSSINYLFNAGMSLGMAEASYSPNIKMGNNVLWSLNLRLWQFNVWGELKLGQNEERGMRLLLGGEWMIIEYKRELWSLGEVGDITWPHTRFMPRVGLSYELPLKGKWVLNPNAGIRIAFNNRMGYDYGANQLWAGMGIAYRVYRW